MNKFLLVNSNNEHFPRSFNNFNESNKSPIRSDFVMEQLDYYMKTLHLPPLSSYFDIQNNNDNDNISDNNNKNNKIFIKENIKNLLRSWLNSYFYVKKKGEAEVGIG
jgi:hypothetical protein